MKDDLEELSIAARRGALPKAEQQGLERAFDDAPDERIWHRAGLRFDAEDAPLPGDAAATGRLLERMLATQPTALARPRRRRPVVLLAAAAVFVASAAAAVAGIRYLREADPTPAEQPPPETTSSPQAAPRAVAAPVTEPAPEAPVVPDETKAAPELEPERRQRPLDNVDELPETAAELLSSAGQARRKGEAARAVTLLEALQSRFPGSAEARASDITLGMLRLQMGASGAALRDFDRYLARSPGGDRTADALWGRSKALLALKRPSEAEKSLRQLLAGYPQSAFASAARAELRQLSP